MELKGERLLPADRATAWALLNDIEVLKLCVPGCESMTAIGEHSYEVVMNAAIGPVKARFKGRLSLTDIAAPSRYTLLFDGQSSQAGFVRGEAKIELQDGPLEQTRLIYVVASQVGGKLAQIGSRLVDAAAVATADKFFECFAAQLAARTNPASATSASQPAQARFGLWSWLRSFIRHLFSH
jgi:carbon monoxide dehydrogenase subunit G